MKKVQTQLQKLTKLPSSDIGGSILTYGSSWSKIKYRAVRDELIKVLGSACRHCQVSDMRVLCVDHVNGGGHAEIKQLRGIRYYQNVLDKIKNNSLEYQLLCHNCNWIKRNERYEERIGKPQKFLEVDCLCGCGIVVNKYDRRNRNKLGYVSGHNSRVKNNAKKN